jgi:hypothetical protein
VVFFFPNSLSPAVVTPGNLKMASPQGKFWVCGEGYDSDFQDILESASQCAGPSSSSSPKPKYQPKPSAEEAARRSKLSNEEKQKEAEAVRDEFDAKCKDFKEESWWGDAPEPKATPSSSSNPPKSEESTAENENVKKFLKSTSNLETHQPGSKKQRQEEKRQRRDLKKEQQHREQIAQTSKAQVNFESWSQSCAKFFSSSDQTFPQLPSYGCDKNPCVRGERLGVCHYEMERTMLGSGYYSRDWLKKERLKWHPDKFQGVGETQYMQLKCSCWFRGSLMGMSRSNWSGVVMIDISFSKSFKRNILTLACLQQGLLKPTATVPNRSLLCLI